MYFPSKGNTFSTAKCFRALLSLQHFIEHHIDILTAVDVSINSNSALVVGATENTIDTLSIKFHFCRFGVTFPAQFTRSKFIYINYRTPLL